jgi:hypothetical protein
MGDLQWEGNALKGTPGARGVAAQEKIHLSEQLVVDDTTAAD